MSKYIKGLDNAAVICHVNQENFSKFEKMGFQLYPLGRQGVKIGGFFLKGGTGSLVANFKNGGYFEMISIYNKFLITGGYKKMLRERGERLVKYTLELTSAKGEAERLKKEGKKPFGPMVFRRVFTSQTKGKQDARFSIMVYPNPLDYPINVSGTEHLTPEITRQDDLLDHPNGALMLSNVLVVAESVADAVRQYESDFLESFKKIGNQYVCKFKNQSRVSFISKAALAEEFPEINVDTDPYIAAVYFAVKDLNAVKEIFELNDVPFSIKRNQLIVPHSYLFNSTFVFEEIANLSTT